MRILRLRLVALAMAALAFCAGNAAASPALLIELDSGSVLYEDQATQPWYPASLTKLMTVYVALTAVREQRITLDTPLAVSARAAAMPPSKMGFRPGTLVTLGNALKMLMVKSANDIAITIAEGVSGSVEAFADEMNEAAASLGLRQSHFVNPNGLPNPQHVSSARDLAILARALYLTFPDQAGLFSIGALQLDGKIITNHNNLLGRYPGADGMKTGFTCAAGFNVVASATQGGRKLIVVVLGAPNVALRTVKAAALFDRGFAGIDRPSGSLATLLAAGGLSPPDRQNAICRKRGPAIAEFNAEVERLMAPLVTANSQAFAAPAGGSVYDSSALSRLSPMATRITLAPTPYFDPAPVSVGAPNGYVGPIAQARAAHSPVGAEPPPDAARAYADTKPPALTEGSALLSPDMSALPMKGRAAHALRTKAKHAHAARPALARTETGSTENKDATASTEAHHAKVAKVAKETKGGHSAKGKSAANQTGAGKAKAATRPRPKPAIKIAAKPHGAPAAAHAGKPANKKANTHSGQTHAAQ